MNMKGYEQLMLQNQLCFPLYACARQIVNRYTPYLKPLGLTYTQYIVMMVLWEKDGITVGEIGKKLFLDNGTLTPLLKKLEGMTDKNKETAKPDGCYDEATIRQFIGIFESFLTSKGICLSGNEKNAAGISGADYGALSGRIEALLNGLGLQKRG